MDLTRRRCAIVLAALVTTLAPSGCVSVLPNPKPPIALIDLPDDRARAPSVSLDTAVAVFAPDATQTYAGADIVVRSNQEIVYLSDVRLADAAPRLLQGAVINALTRAIGAGGVTAAELATRSEFDLRWRIVEWSASRGSGPVRAIADVSLVQSATRRVIAQDRIEVEESPTGKSERERGAAIALVGQELANRVAQFVAERAKIQDKPVGASGR